MNNIAKHILIWPYLSILITSFMIVYIIPTSFIFVLPGFDWLLEWLPKHVPAIRDNILASKLPDVAVVYYSVFFVISPIAAVGAWRAEGNKHESWVTSFRLQPGRNFIRLILLLLLNFGGFWITYIRGGTQFNSMPHNDSAFFLALIGHIPAGTGFWILVGVTARALYSMYSKEGT